MELSDTTTTHSFPQHKHHHLIETKGLRKRLQIHRKTIDNGSSTSANTVTSMDDHDGTHSVPLPSEEHPPAQQSLDEFMEVAFQATRGRNPLFSFIRQWRYWCIMLSLGVANSSDASEILCISYILSDPVFRQQILKEGDGGVLAAAVFMGMLIGGLVVGTMGDWLGRRPMLLLGLFCNAIAGVLSAMAPDVWSLSLLRGIAGVGIGATVPPLFTLVTELAPPSARGFCVTLCASFWMVGSMYVALLALWLLEAWGLSWRIFAVACALPSALGAFLVVALVPESPRFLGLEQRSKEAVDVANSLACRKMNYYGAPLRIDELERSFPSSAIRDLENRQVGTTNYRGNGNIWGLARMALIDFYTSTSKLYTPQLQRTTWPLQMVWFSLSFGSYGLLTWINTIFVEVHLQNVYFNALLFSASNLPGNILTACFMDRVGRSPMLIASVVFAALSLVSFAACANVSNSTGIVLSACLFQCFTIAAWNTIDTMTSELFPTLVRSTGMGICAASGRIGAMVAQFVNGALVANHPVKLLLVASGTLLLGAATPCLLPDGDMTGQPVHDGLNNNSTMVLRRIAPFPAIKTSGAARGEPYVHLQLQQSPEESRLPTASQMYSDIPSDADIV
jgi:MFS family permease